MKVWIVEYKGEIVGASTDEVEACRCALLAGGFSQDSIDNAVLDGCIEAAESIGATVREVDIVALERVAEAAVAWRDAWTESDEAATRQRLRDAVTAMEVEKAREQVRRGETCTEAELRDALGVDDAGEEG